MRSVVASTLSVSAQTRLPVGGVLLPAAQQTAAGGTQVRRLTADEAVRLAAENNLGIQIARFDPQIEDLNILQARTAWTPTLNSSLQQNSNTSPPNSFLSGAQGGAQLRPVLDDDRRAAAAARGAAATRSAWTARDRRRTTSSATSTRSSGRRCRSTSRSRCCSGFRIDSTREQLQVSQKNREIADVELRETLTATSRTVRNAYWELAYQIASLQVARQSLELAEESLRNTRARVEIGTTPPIDIVEADAEVSARREAVIVGEAQIGTAEDTLRALVYNPSMPDFWTIRIEPVDMPPFEPTPVDVDAAIRTALDRRTDLLQTRKSIEATDINIRFLRNQTLPDVTAQFDYGLSALGGVQFLRTAASA